MSQDGEELERQAKWQALGIRTDIPHPARVYNYHLGGKDNFAADRAMGDFTRQRIPQIVDSARANRDFQGRAVRFLRDSGIGQFLDIGTGLPISPNTHELAPGARVVYVDNDPVVFLHAEALMAESKTTRVVRADMRDVDVVLAEAGEQLDLTQPVGLLFIAVLHNIPDADDPTGLVARYLDAVAPGSYLVISHLTDEFAPAKVHEISAENARRGSTFIGRSRESIIEMFNGHELVDPGLVPAPYWRPDGGRPTHNADRAWGYSGVARLARVAEDA
jgi:SAM-dependent methyltransferase